MKKVLLLLTIAFGLTPSAHSTHIAGGDFSVQWVSGNTFIVTLKMFRDCASGGAAFDNPINITVFDNVTNAVTQTFGLPLLTITPITLGDECYSPPGSVCIEEGFYQATISLPNNPNGYYMAWERCCRNPGIQNIINPASSGMVFYVQVPDPALQNSTPVFGSYPADGYLCQGVENVIDFGVTEADGDSMVFSLITPLMGALSSSASPAPGSALAKPYPTVTWQAPYSLADIVGGTPPMSIDPNTGVITCYPTGTGIFVFAVMIEEYRAGVKISESIRDIQYYVLNCVIDDLPEIMLPDTISVLEGGTACFDIVVIDQDVTDSISILVSSPLTFADGATVGMPVPFQTTPDTTYQFFFTNETTGLPDSIVLPRPVYAGGAYFGVGAIGLQYCWTTSCEDIDNSPFMLEVAAFSLGCSGDTNFLDQTTQVFVVPQPLPNQEIFLPDTISIVSGSTQCFDIVVLSSDPMDTVNIMIDGTTFPAGAVLSQPTPVSTSPNMYEYFYWNPATASIDSVILGEPVVTGNVYSNPGGVGLHYCWETSCEDIDNNPFSIEVTSFGFACNGDTIAITDEAELTVIPQTLPDQQIFLPDTISIVARYSNCFDVVVLSDSPSDTVSIVVKSPSFPMGATLTLPTPVSTSPNMYEYFYWNPATGDVDSVILPQPTLSGGTYTGVGGIGLHYCWETGCEDIREQMYQVQVGAYRIGCYGDSLFVYDQAFIHVTPPDGEQGIVPNVFTPNGDNMNDLFKLGGLINYCYDSLNIQVFNRWGQLVYESDEPGFTWDGKNKKGEEVSEGTYYVVINGIFGDADITRHYPIQLFRNK